MSVSFSCKCEERKKPASKRNWVVLKYKHHNSAFNGYRDTDSDYSSVFCFTCRALGRTKAKYADSLKVDPDALSRLRS